MQGRVVVFTDGHVDNGKGANASSDTTENDLLAEGLPLQKLTVELRRHPARELYRAENSGRAPVR